MSSFTNVQRHPEWAVGDGDAAYLILDQALMSHVAFADDGVIFNIPMTFARIGDSIFFHSSKQGRFYNVLVSGTSVCADITILDGMVLAKSAFNTSMNYRSVMIFGGMVDVTDYDRKYAISEAIAEKMVPGRWNDCRHPSRAEISATGFLELPLEQMSVKVNIGGPSEKKVDETLPYWSGVVKLKTSMSVVSSDSEAELPNYIVRHVAGEGKSV